MRAGVADFKLRIVDTHATRSFTVLETTDALTLFVGVALRGHPSLLLQEGEKRLDGPDGLREAGGVKSVKNFLARDPAAARHGDAVLDVIHCFD